MKCTEVRKLFSDFIENQISKKNMEVVKKHLSKCVECRKDLKIFERTIKLIRSSGFIKPSKRFLKNLESRISLVISK